jgi:putative two-component system response regulator
MVAPRVSGLPDEHAIAEENMSTHAESIQTTSQGVHAARVLVVDDEETNVRLLERALRRDGYSSVVTTTEPTDVPELFAAAAPDIVLLDLHMPGLDGFGVLDILGMLIPHGSFLPILVLTADATVETKRRALAAGATDFLTKPFDLDEVLLRIRNMLLTRRLHLELEDQNELLETRVRERTRQLEAAQMDTLDRLAMAAEYRDDATGQHIHRVGAMSATLASRLGVTREETEALRAAATLHDVGKIGVPDNILLKPGRLTPEEFAQIKTHTTIGGRLLAGGRSPVLAMAREIALYHHERWDGTGYAGVAGPEVPLPARIVSVADAFDAMTSDRPYKRAMELERALEEIRRCSGSQFDPEVVAVFLEGRLNESDVQGRRAG